MYVSYSCTRYIFHSSTLVQVPVDLGFLPSGKGIATPSRGKARKRRGTQARGGHRSPPSFARPPCCPWPIYHSPSQSVKIHHVRPSEYFRYPMATEDINEMVLRCEKTGKLFFSKKAAEVHGDETGLSDFAQVLPRAGTRVTPLRIEHVWPLRRYRSRRRFGSALRRARYASMRCRWIFTKSACRRR